MGQGKPSLAWKAVKALYRRAASRALGDKAAKGSALPKSRASINKQGSAQHKTLLTKLSAFRTFGKTLSERVTTYAKGNKKTILKYTGLYALLWSVEWLLGTQLGYFAIALLVLSLAYDLYVFLSHPLGGARYLSLLKAKELLVKKRTKLQEILGGILLTLYTGYRSFLTNPSFRLAQAQVFKVASLGWLIVLVDSFIEGVANMLLVAAKGGLPRDYPKGRQEALFLLEDFCYEALLHHNTSHVIAWLFSLVAFLVLTSKVFLLTKVDLPPLIVGALRTFVPHVALFVVLEALKGLIMGHIILSQFFLAQNTAIGLYLFFQPAWTIFIYLRIFRYCWARSTRTQVEVFCFVFSFVEKRRGNPFIRGLTALFKYGCTAIGFMVCCSLYLLIRALLF